MVKILIICKTLYQLIMAMQMKNTIFMKDLVDLIVTDHSPVDEKLAVKIKKSGYFHEVNYLCTMGYCARKKPIKERLSDVMDIVKGKGLYNLPSYKYDLFLYFNVDLDTLVFFANAYNSNRDIECARYEESILSYDSSLDSPIWKGGLKYKLGKSIRKFMGKSNLSESTRTFYCCYPGLYKGELSVVEIPRIDIKGPVGVSLKDIFDLNEENLNYKEKYIYFSSVYDFEGGEPIGEIMLAKEIRDCVGNDNLLIKLHPRDRRNIYEDEGFHIDCHSKVPWEAIQLNVDFSDKVFITATSSSVLSINMLLNNMPETVFAYPCCYLEENESAKKTVDIIERLLVSQEAKRFMKNVRVIENVGEL